MTSSHTWCSTTAGSSSPTPASRRPTTAAPPGGCAAFALYGDTTGETDEFGLPVRYPWANDYRGRAMVLYGHTPTPEAEWVNNTMCLDTGCVFGGQLTALRYPEREVVSVPAERVWYEPAKPFLADTATGLGAGRGADGLDITDVLGRRGVETAHHGRVTVREENAAGALEVMSRFALDPRWLLYLPPTMSPCATSPAADLLEHPAEAFAAYRAEGVDRGDLRGEAHGLPRRRPGVPRRGCRPGTVRLRPTGSTGVVYTRTGRPFFEPDLNEELVSRLRRCARPLPASGTSWRRDWVLLDAELLPWSLKAEDLLRRQYASVGAAARSALPAAVDGLATRGRVRARRRGATGPDGFPGCERRRLHRGLPALRVADRRARRGAGRAVPGARDRRPRRTNERDHSWHLGIADRFVAADPGLVRPTRRLLVDAEDEHSLTAGVAWWEELTAAGGEGMVVKPHANLTRGRRGLVQPGMKVRGREYLRIIYGPDYTEPSNLDRLRQRSLGHKRSMALREYALGLESLDPSHVR